MSACVPGKKKKGPNESAGSRLGWAFALGAVGAIGAAVGGIAVYAATDVGDSITVEKIREAIASSEDLQLKIGKAASGPTADKLIGEDAINLLFRDSLAVDPPRDPSRFRGPPGPPGISAPLGSIVAWPIAQDAPARWRVCKGDILDIEKDDCKPLADLLGATYGAVGPGKVKLPDFRGYFLRGHGRADSGPGALASLNRIDSRNVGSAQVQAVRCVAAAVADPKEEGDFIQMKGPALAYGNAKPADESFNADERSKAYHETKITTGTVAETRPMNVAIHWIIRVK